MVSPRIRRTLSFVSFMLFALAAPAFAQVSPWERTLRQLEFAITGPIAQASATIAVAVGGILLMFGDHGAKKGIANIVLGGGMALFAVQFMAWLF